MEISQDAIYLLIFLAPGFLAFRVYMIDADWRGLRQLDIVYGSLIFSALSYACYFAFNLLGGPDNLFWLVAITFTSGVVLATAWKRIGHPLFHRLLNILNITNEDNRGDVWQKIFNDPRIYVTQITAYLKSGEAIQCDETKAFDRPELRAKGIFPYYTHRDRQICFVPNRRKRSPEAEWEDVRDIEAPSEWGLRMVYINADELQRLELRIAPVAQ